MAQIEIDCHECRHTHRFDERVPFREECEKCCADLHVCLACAFYDRYVENQCRESEADPVAAKDRANLCEYFRIKRSGEGEDQRVSDAKSKLAALFGESEITQAPSEDHEGDEIDPQVEAKRRLEALFNKK